VGTFAAVTASAEEWVVVAALAITFDDRRMCRRLALSHPEALERAQRALELLDRRERRFGLPA
jgi:hypothetical protein